jgi:flavin reductase (DIM6/NTAB) family NADH-FMN oxidoreductase RutF
METSMTDSYFYEIAKGHGLPHDPFKAIVAPRPVGWISTVDAQGLMNLAPYSFFNAVCDQPPILMFCSAGWKDSVANVEATGEFVWNLATRPLAQAMNITSAAVPHETSEFDLAGLTAAPSRLVKAPRVAQTPAALECRRLQITQLHDLEGAPTGNFMVLGQVVAVHIDPAFLIDGLFDTAAAQPIGRCGYRGDYAEVDHLFQMARPGS